MPTSTAPAEALIADIASRVVEIRSSIAVACERVDRDPAEVRLIAVTKTFSLDIVRAGIEAGLTDLAENRVQELDEKASAIPGEHEGGSVRWHLVGSLQRNKAKRALEIADVFHALDSDRLAQELNKRAVAADRVVPCYVQVNVSGEGTKSGVAPEEAPAFLTRLAAYEALDVIGLMTLAAPAETEEELETIVRPQFRTMARLASAAPIPLRLSMGMSGDYEIAIEEGATDVRIGTALFGHRPPPAGP